MFRLQQKSSGKFYVMSDSSPVPMDRQSSLFNKQDDYLTSKSYSFEFDLEPNRALINNSHYINTSNTRRTDEVIAWDATRPLQDAKMVFKIKRDKIIGELYFDGSIINPRLKNLKLSEMGQIDHVDGQINFANTNALQAYMMASITGDHKTTPILFFPVKNENAYNTIPPEEQAGYTNINFPFNNYMNAWLVNFETGEGAFAQDPPGGPYRQTRLPFFKLTYVLRRVIKALGYIPDGRWLDEDDANRIVIYTNVSSYSEIIADYSFYMPAITIGDFIKELRSRLGLLINFDETSKLCKVESIRNIRSTGRVVDMRKKQLADTYEEIDGLPNAYIISQSVDDKDKAFDGLESDDLPILTIGDVSGAINVQEIPLTSVISRMYNGTGPQGADWRTPEVQTPVAPMAPFDQISPLEYSERSTFKLRLFYYHGMADNSAGYSYPYASSDNLDRHGDRLTKFSLALNITGNTYSSLKEYYTYIRNSKPFYMDFNLSLQEYFTQEASDRILVKDFDESTVECLFDVASADLDDREIVRVRIALYPDIQPDNTTMPTQEPDEPVIPPPDPPYENGVVYAKLSLENYVRIESPYPPPFYNRTNVDVYVKFFADAAGTIPKNVVDLKVRVRTRANVGPTSTANYVNEYTVTSVDNKDLLMPNAPAGTNSGGTSYGWAYTLEPAAGYTII